MQVRLRRFFAEYGAPGRQVVRIESSGRRLPERALPASHTQFEVFFFFLVFAQRARIAYGQSLAAVPGSASPVVLLHLPAQPKTNRSPTPYSVRIVIIFPTRTAASSAGARRPARWVLGAAALAHSASTTALLSAGSQPDRSSWQGRSLQPRLSAAMKTQYI